jgi:uncharacterized delta-60 repeat protein
MAIRRSLTRVSFVLASAVVVLVPGVARAAPGDLDHSFGGGDGIVTYQHGNGGFGQKMLLQPDGKVVVAGDVVAGSTDSDLFLARYNKDGTPDHSFGGGDGVVTRDFLGGYDDWWGLNRMSDGRLVVVGYAEPPGGSPDKIAVARFSASGTRDNTFSGDGKTTTTIPGYSGADAWRSVLQSNGKLVVVGEGFPSGGGGDDIVVLRYNVDGTLDSTFNGDGRLAVDLGGNDFAWGANILQGGTIVVVGGANTSSEGKIGIIWVKPSGYLDTAFGGGDGKAAVNLVNGNNQEQARAVFPLSSGKLLVVGNARASGGSNSQVFEARLDANGAKDSTFGGGDGVVLSGGGGDDVDFGASRRSDGTVVVGGWTDLSGFFVERLRPDGSADPAFGTGGFARPFGSAGLGYDAVFRSDGRVVATGVNKHNQVATVQLLG